MERPGADEAGNREARTAQDTGADATEPSSDDPGADGIEPSPAEADGAKPGSRPVRKKPISLRSQLLIGVICVVLGFAIVTQVRQTADDEFAGLRQDDLIRLLDEVTQRNQDLSAEGENLRRDRNALRSGSDAQRLAEEYQLVLGVLAGTEPVEGPGVVVTIEGVDEVSAQVMVHMLEELRNAGAEAVELSGQRLTASSSFVDSDEGVLADGVLLSESMEWRAIGNSQTMAVALDIPGGALAGFRNVGAVVAMEQRDLVQITSIREVREAEFAAPAEPEE